MTAPLDPRLLRQVRPVRGYVALTAVLSVVTAGALVAQAELIGSLVSSVVAGSLAGLGTGAALLACVVIVRAGVAWVAERFGDRAATDVIVDLRGRLVAHAVALGPEVVDPARRIALAALAVDGLDALRPYLTRYLPQLVATAVVMPVLLVVVALEDPLSALLLAVTLPLVPLFMVLVGLATRAAAARRLVTLQRLGSQVVDLLVGLPTLVALGRERGPAARVRALGEAHRRATTVTLRTAFLSSLVLELVTTLSVAVVAVGIGLRLLGGHLDLRTALVVLVLAPEVYLPLRQVGAQFHASADGLAAVEATFVVLDRPVPAPGTQAAPDLRSSCIVLRGAGVRHAGRASAAPADLDLVLRPGSVTALVGPSGCGKTTAAHVVLGLRRVDEGTAEVVDAHGRRTDLAGVDPTGWLAQATYLGQQALVVPGTLRENALLLTSAGDAALDAAARVSGLAEVVDGLAVGWDTPVGRGGHGLSAGERQRLALTRVLLTSTPLVVLDEPSAHLDAGTERHVLEVVRALAARGRTVLLVAHRASLVAEADEVVEVAAAVGAR